jgi:hypothetical protein
MPELPASAEGSALLLPDGRLPIAPRPGRRLGQARVVVGDGGLPGDDVPAGAIVPLGYVLLRLNQTPIGRRYPVVAEPEWLAPPFLHGLFARRHVSMVVPITQALIGDHPGAVIWLDRRQVAVFDSLNAARSRVLSDHAALRVELPSGEVLGQTHRYARSGGAESHRGLTYDEIVPAALPPDADGDQIPAGLRLRATSPVGTFDGFGQAVIRLNREDARRLAAPGRGSRARHVTVRPITRYRGDVEVLARVLLRDGDAPGAELDQVVREAIGVEVGEEVVLAAVEVPRRRWPDLLIGRPNHVTCRVQSADVSTLEREVCLLDELSLELLGVASGDEVVIDGLHDPETGAVQSLRVRAFATSDAVQRRRESLHGGDFGARFPSARDALGVHPDLPWIFLVDKTQQRLMLRAATLGTVRVRSSRIYQLRREVREVALLLGIAYVGLLQLIRYRPAQLVAFVVLLSIVAASVVLRMRGRLSYRVR